MGYFFTWTFELSLHAVHTAQFYYIDPYMNSAATGGKPGSWPKQENLLNFLPTKVGSLPYIALND